MKDLITVFRQYVQLVFGQNKSFIVDADHSLEDGKYAAMTVISDVTGFTCDDITLDTDSADYPTEMVAGITLYGYFVNCSVDEGAIKFYSK